MSRTSGFRTASNATRAGAPLLLLAALACGGAESDTGVQIVPARIAPVTRSDVAVAVLSPQAGAVTENPVALEVVLGGFELGVPTPDAESRGILLAENGQHLHVVVDDEPYLAVHDVSRPFVLPDLSPGVHTVRVFPAWQWHEVVQGPGAFETVQFYVGEQSGEMPVRPGAPLLTFSRPIGTYAGADADSILLDFALRNANLGQGAYKVRVTVDGEHVDDLTTQIPYYLVGLTAGEHTVELQLRDVGGRIVPGVYNTSSRTITVMP